MKSKIYKWLCISIVVLFLGTSLYAAIQSGIDVTNVNCVTGCSSGSTTPTDAFANPTTAGLSDSFNSIYNGTTWDRVRSGQTSGVGTNVTTGVQMNAMYAYDFSGTGANTYKAVSAYGQHLMTMTDVNGGYVNITTNTDTLIDGGAGASLVLHRLIIDIAGSSDSRVRLWSESDGAVPCGGTGGIIALFDASVLRTIDFNLLSGADICVTTSGTTAPNVLLQYTLES